ncbi:MAG: lipoyl(octanoyl) transferase [Gemmatimonadaceae bacterium]|jgi:lipoate-protein ligase A|nr:lipoyl(octanoyl) transferase [Gemmatimonadaceae bacterium]
MARDTALQARAAKMGETVFSVYSWTRPTLSFGRHQPANGLYDAQKLQSAGLDVVRRPTGGRAILHNREVTYSVTAPVEGAEPLRAAYSRINRILLDGLARLGVVAGIASSGERAPAPSIRPCFETPGEGELVADGGKLVGSAQWRDGGALLQHGSILVEDDQSSLGFFAAGPVNESLASIAQPATLAALLGRAPDASEVASALFDAVRSLEDAEAEELGEDEIREEALKHLPQYLDKEWTWRR